MHLLGFGYLWFACYGCCCNYVALSKAQSESVASSTWMTFRNNYYYLNILKRNNSDRNNDRVQGRNNVNKNTDKSQDNDKRLRVETRGSMINKTGIKIYFQRAWNRNIILIF